ncbi:hypothetical protein CEP54_012311 [Fusarium duplospermum]|uniref:Uncharacterized protein n=1 Tax=Fusarium duplospermum TaxID=1325734 RepID=A0A428P9H7_9HYPO|nr:hypothetical protein CEP54_012311 [Fusarium duplospermum]
MPPKRPPQGSRVPKPEKGRDQAQIESTTSSDNFSFDNDNNNNHSYYNEEGAEDEASGSDVTVGNTRSGRTQFKPTRHHLVPNRPGMGMSGQPRGPSTQVPPSQPYGPSQGHIPELPPGRYPSQTMNYPPENPKQGDFPPYGSQPAHWSGMYSQQPMPSNWGPHFYSQYTGESQPGPRSSAFYQSLRTQQSQPPKADSKPAAKENSTPAPKEDSTPAREEEPTPAPTLTPTPPPKADPRNVNLEVELATLKAQKEKRDRENEIRRELDDEMQHLRDQLEKAKQEASKKVELAKLQGERDAMKRFDEIRREEQEKQRQLAEQRMELEGEIRVKLETERLVEIFQRESKERQLEELQKQAAESILERLDDAVAVSQAKLLQGNEMEAEPDAAEGKKPIQDLLLSEMKTIRSHLRRSFVWIPESDHVSSHGRESRSNSRSGSPRHHAKDISVSDRFSSRYLESSLAGSRQAEWEDFPPPVPDAPTEDYDIQEQHDYMTNHSTYSDDAWDFVPGYRAGQHDPRSREGGRIRTGYQAHERMRVEDIVQVTGAVLEHLGIPHWNPPIHRPPDDRPYDQPYRTHRREPPNINDYADSFDMGPPYGDVTVIYDGPDDESHHGGSCHDPRPYKSRQKRERPAGAIPKTPSRSSGTSTTSLPSLSAEESDISTDDDVETQSSTLPKLLENKNSVKEDPDTDSDSASTADSDSTIFHEASETMTEYSVIEGSRIPQDDLKVVSAGCEDGTERDEHNGMFAYQMELWKEKMRRQ